MNGHFKMVGSYWICKVNTSTSRLNCSIFDHVQFSEMRMVMMLVVFQTLNLKKTTTYTRRITQQPINSQSNHNISENQCWSVGPLKSCLSWKNLLLSFSEPNFRGGNGGKIIGSIIVLGVKGSIRCCQLLIRIQYIKYKSINQYLYIFILHTCILNIYIL